MTLADGEITMDQGRPVLKLGTLSLELPADHLSERPEGTRRVTVAVRPEDILIGTGQLPGQCAPGRADGA